MSLKGLGVNSNHTINFLDQHISFLAYREEIVYPAVLKVEDIPSKLIPKAMKLKVLVWQKEDQWCASVPALPGCHTWEDSYDHLMEMVKEAIEGWLEVANEQEETTESQQLVEINL